MIIPTDVGPLTVGHVKGELICLFGSHHVDSPPDSIVVEQLEAYFSGSIIEQFDVPLPNGTPFTHRCLQACRSIPYGTTITYAQLAVAARSPKACRAAGQAMRRNPTSIITPCHRVIASTGALHGYAGSTDQHSRELCRKQFLLDLERRTIGT